MNSIKIGNVLLRFREKNKCKTCIDPCVWANSELAEAIGFVNTAEAWLDLFNKIQQNNLTCDWNIHEKKKRRRKYR